MQGSMVQELHLVPKHQRNETVAGVSIPFLCDIFSVDIFDYIKIDIGGTEKEVFTPKPEKGYQLKFLEHLKMASIATHSNRDGAHEAVTTAFAEHQDLSGSISGDFLIWKRSRRPS